MESRFSQYKQDITFRDALIRLYKLLLPHLLQNYPRWDPYPIVQNISFTPIEENVWANIRMAGLPMLPQFPEGKYFLDFADPVKKIGIEVDGRKWHQDKEKDKIRQDWLESKGWKIFRITGLATYFDRDNFENIQDKEFFPNLPFQMEGTMYNCSSEEAIFKIKKAFYSDIYDNLPKRDELVSLFKALQSTLDRMEQLVKRHKAPLIVSK